MEHRNPIRVVAKRTGMSPHLIRMWERRYSAVQPVRTSTGRRLYSEDDIERLTLLRQATLEGQTISQIAQLSADELRELIPEVVGVVPDDSPDRNLEVEQHLDLCLHSMRDLDAVSLETRLMRASLSLGQKSFLEDLLHPLLELTGEMWADGRLQVAHEHLASAVIRSLLGSMYLSDTSNGTAPLLISTTPSGQHHEFGALMASVTAARSRWRAIYLGANMPAEDIVTAARSRGASAIALSLVYPSDDPGLPDQLRRIRQLSGGAIPILAGGRASGAYATVLDEIGAIRIQGLDDLKSQLDLLHNKINSPPLVEG